MDKKRGKDDGWFRKERQGGSVYAYLMESYRNEDGEPRNKRLKYLGPCGAEDWIEEECEKCGSVGDCWNGLCADCLASNLRDE